MWTGILIPAPNPVVLSFVGSATSTTGTVDIGTTGRLIGDLCVILDQAQSGSSTVPSSVTPSGFTLGVSFGQNTTDNNAGRINVSAKLLDGTETSLNGMTAPSTQSQVALVFRPNRPLYGFSFNSISSQVTSSNPSPQTITASTSTSSPTLAVGQMAASNPVSPRTVSPAMNEVSASTSHYAHWLLQNPGVNITYDMDDEGICNCIQSMYITLSS